MMYVPGSDERKIEKIPNLGADCVCIDCEDGVAYGMKDQVRLYHTSLTKFLKRVKLHIFVSLESCIFITLNNRVSTVIHNEFIKQIKLNKDYDHKMVHGKSMAYVLATDCSWTVSNIQRGYIKAVYILSLSFRLVGTSENFWRRKNLISLVDPSWPSELIQSQVDSSVSVRKWRYIHFFSVSDVIESSCSSNVQFFNILIDRILLCSKNYNILFLFTRGRCSSDFRRS